MIWIVGYIFGVMIVSVVLGAGLAERIVADMDDQPALMGALALLWPVAVPWFLIAGASYLLFLVLTNLALHIGNLGGRIAGRISGRSDSR